MSSRELQPETQLINCVETAGRMIQARFPKNHVIIEEVEERIGILLDRIYLLLNTQKQPSSNPRSFDTRHVPLEQIQRYAYAQLTALIAEIMTMDSHQKIQQRMIKKTSLERKN